MKRIFSRTAHPFFILLCSLFFILSCSKDKAPQTEGYPKRIVSLVPSLTDAVIFHGAEDRLVGVSKFCIPAIEKRKSVAVISDALRADAEAIVALKPDLVLTHSWQDENIRKQLERAGIKVMILPEPVSLGEIARNIETVGIILGDTESAKKRVEKWKDDIRKVLAFAPSSESLSSESPSSEIRHLKTYVQIYSPGRWTIGKKSYLNNILFGLGLDNIFIDEDFSYKEVNDESIIDADPELILFLDAHDTSLAKDKVLEKTSAGRSNNFVFFSDRDITIPGPRLLEAIIKLKTELDKIRKTNSKLP
ncbi:MAG: hypothetical protein COS94_03995 [Candidatus Hydrogenedentes bacterium CG07_land_8_20_14_0_80_42_17]|nr:MAG: hypothetical protein COS94_03995 [Candidatus Hydrogenedentes bacterium CG07_land_8_20_14_0_80_42_17]